MIKSLHKKFSNSLFKRNKNDNHYLVLVLLYFFVISFPAILDWLPYPLLCFNILFIVFILYGLSLLEEISILHILSGIGAIVALTYASINIVKENGEIIIEGRVEYILMILYLILTGQRLLIEGVKEEVSLKLIYISISNYLTIGLIFAFTYKILHLSQPNAFNFLPKETYQHIYVSFVTLTSTGFGDLLPTQNPAKALIVLEAIIGQLYLTFFVAIVIGKYLSPKVK